MAYDPCTCFWESVIGLDFKGLLNGKLDASGVILGSAVSVTDLNGNDKMMGDLFSDKYLTSYMDQSADPLTADQMVANF
jgi:hypothetical protein